MQNGKSKGHTQKEKQEVSMNKNLVITIARQYGSGGKEVGQKLAAELHVPFYDKNLIIEAAQKDGIDSKLFEEAEERANDSLIYALAMGQYVPGNKKVSVKDLTLYDRVYKIQSDVIRRVAAEGPCVIVGRCGDYILKDLPHCIRVFIHAEIRKRLQRAIEDYHLPPELSNETFVRKKDKRRSNYHKYYTDLQWGEAESYHVSLDSGSIDTDCCVRVLMEYIRTYCKKMELCMPGTERIGGQK